MLRDLWEAINISGAVQFWIKSGRGKWIRYKSSIDFYRNCVHIMFSSIETISFYRHKNMF